MSYIASDKPKIKEYVNSQPFEGTFRVEVLEGTYS